MPSFFEQQRRFTWGLIGLVLGCVASAPLLAQDLTIGVKAAVDGSDPDQSYSPNRNVQLHVYETLATQDGSLHVKPGLATDWKVIDPTTWEFHLRPGVKFQDGSPLTAADAAFSIDRARTTQGMRTYAAQMRAVTATEVIDAATLRIHTSVPTPLLPTALVVAPILLAKAATGATEADFNGGRAAIGTGPYRWGKLTPSDNVTLTRNDDYWGAKEPWRRVTFRFIANDSARIAALLAGDVDVIDSVPGALYAAVRADARVTLITGVSVFNLYLYLDQFRDRALFVTGPDGEALDHNPLRDVRVRQAMSHAINRDALAQRAMQGGADPSDQIAPPGFVGHDDAIKPIDYDPALARRLLTEAGYKRGFGITLHCTNDRFSGDALVCQAVGQMLATVGIHTNIEVLPSAIYFRRAYGGAPDGRPEFSASMSIYASTTGDSSEGMTTILRTYDTKAGHGALNRGRYSDPVLDDLLAKQENEFDPAARLALVNQATERAMDQAGAIPVFYLRSGWGLRKGLTLDPRGDQYTMATTIRAVP